MIHISSRNPIERETFKRICEKHKHKYKTYEEGITNEELSKLPYNSQILGRLALTQFFAVKNDIEVFIPSFRKTNLFNKYLLSRVSVDGKQKRCMILLEESIRL